MPKLDPAWPIPTNALACVFYLSHRLGLNIVQKDLESKTVRSIFFSFILLCGTKVCYISFLPNSSFFPKVLNYTSNNPHIIQNFEKEKRSFKIMGKQKEKCLSVSVFLDLKWILSDQSFNPKLARWTNIEARKKAWYPSLVPSSFLKILIKSLWMYLVHL